MAKSKVNSKVNQFYTARKLTMNNYRPPSHAIVADHPVSHGDAYASPTTYSGTIKMEGNPKKFPAKPPVTFFPDNLNSYSGEPMNGRKSKNVKKR
jgi:hypothetical protein